MPIQSDDGTQAVLAKLLQENGLAPESLLYRETERSGLTPTGAPGVFRLSANAHPSESVVDIYGPGYVVQAEQLGPGLAFVASPSLNWQETLELRAIRSKQAQEKVEVEVRLQDLLAQGGRMYPVESVSVERAWYFTLPAGSIEVREAGPRSA
jgi:hypothetical protein